MSDTFNYIREPLEDAFSRAVGYYRGKLLSHARSIHSEGEDLLQETFFEMWRHVNRNGMPPTCEDFKKWAYCVLDWKYKDSCKKRTAGKRAGALQNVSLSDWSEDSCSSNDRTPLNNASAKEIESVVSSLIGRLQDSRPSIARSAYLGIIEGFSNEENALKQGISSNAVGVQVFRFRKDYGPILKRKFDI